MVDHIPELVSIGLDSLKIEGRAKSAYYAAVTTGAYRHAIDAALAGEELDPVWREELDKISTLGCILMDTTDKRMWVCKGTPCCSPFREYTWQRPDKLAQWQDIVLW